MTDAPPLSWGIAATGGIARQVGGVIARHADMRVAAVGSRDLARARRLADDLGAPAAHGSYDALVQDPTVDAVYVATPHTGHAAVVETALLAGKAVLCEKPMTSCLEETVRLVRLAEESGAFLMEGLWMRFNPLVQHLQQVVRGGQLGEIRSVSASFGFPAAYDPHARLWDPVLGGGALLDLGVYTVDLARLLLGTPMTVEAAGSLAATGVDAESTVALTWSDGARALLSQSLVARLPGGALVVGSRGWAELSAPFHAPTRLVVEVDGGEPVASVLQDELAGYVGELEVAHVVTAHAERRAAASRQLPDVTVVGSASASPSSSTSRWRPPPRRPLLSSTTHAGAASRSAPSTTAIGTATRSRRRTCSPRASSARSRTSSPASRASVRRSSSGGVSGPGAEACCSTSARTSSTRQCSCSAPWRRSTPRCGSAATERSSTTTTSWRSPTPRVPAHCCGARPRRRGRGHAWSSGQRRRLGEAGPRRAGAGAVRRGGRAVRAGRHAVGQRRGSPGPEPQDAVDVLRVLEAGARSSERREVVALS